MKTVTTRKRILFCTLIGGMIGCGVAACDSDDDSSSDKNNETDDGTPTDTTDMDGGTTDDSEEEDTDSATEGGDDSCPGCAVLSVPFTDFETSQIYNIFFDPREDFSGATATFRVKAKDADAGNLTTMVQNGDENGYAGIGTSVEFSDMTDWVDIEMDVDALAADAATFDATNVFALSMIVSAGEDNGGSLVNPTLIYVDEITVTDSNGDVITPWTFDTADEADLLFINSYQPVDGSSVGHIAE